MTLQGAGGAAPGWYPTAPGSAQVRWWDGSQWTEHFQTLGVAPVGPLSAPEGTNPNTLWIWVFVLLPLLQFLEIPAIAAYYGAIFSAGLTDPGTLAQSELAAGPSIALAYGIGLVILGVTVVFAALDFRALRARSVPSPFHWAWTFLSPLVYIIGRTVVVRRRTGRGFAPLWIYIAMVVAYTVASLVVLLPILANAVEAATTTAG